jgi:membrane protease subunit HflC
MRTILLIAAAVVMLVAIRLSLFTVDRTEFVYVTQFGRRVATYDGALADDAGLHLKWPWPIQAVQRLDHRLQHLDLPGAELLTHDPEGKTIDKTLTIDAYICWRVAGTDGVDQFIRAVGTPDRAKTILRQQIGSELGAAIARHQLDDLISTDRGKAPGRTRVEETMETLNKALLSGLRDSVELEYGIELVDIRLRRINHPPAVREEIFARIRSERGKKVADYESDGKRQASNITSAAERKAREIRAQAQAEETQIKGKADAEADAIRNQAFKKDPEFYAFLKKLEEYQRMLGNNKSVLLLSTHRELFDALFQPPRPNGSKPAGGDKKLDKDKP